MFAAAKYVFLTCIVPVVEIEGSAAMWSSISHYQIVELYSFKDTHREKVPSNKIPAPTKCTNMGIWVVGTTNHLFIRGS